ncbi:MAG: ABC transporter permease [Rhodoferax sp.]|jgi:peptide/nickel transport system permease protein|nr:ABC transporter permease [Rhodoferax sp.]MBP9928487.1 ABC transporter permease [Rhodoferax sp.]HQX57820.1 ABC transporter permease [Burkholderiaceae bacterium]HQZ06267.1 ABC transporter permease [Burkholderiaceae bacterium]HRA61438.1 ABC transporter permease [Burkholderiaceae bacterium]
MTSKSNHLPAATTMHTTMLQWLGISIRGVMRTRHGAIGLVLLVLLALVAMAAPSIATFGPFEQTASSLAPPGAEHYFGTDNVGRDIFSMVIYGTRASLAIGFGAAFAALIIGGTIGILAGYFGGWVESVLMRVTELFQTLPVILFVLLAVALFGSSFWLLIAAVTLAIWPVEARLIYGQYLKLRNREFVAAARVIDLSTTHIVLREILPNAIQPVIVQVALDASVAILIEAGLGFLGLSDPNMVSWGQLLFTAQDYMSQAWWMSVFPGAAICLAIIAFNLFADGLNEASDSRRKGTQVGLER